MRIACLLVTALPLRAELRAYPELAPQAVAIASGRDAAARVIACSANALRAGVAIGSSITRARALCPELNIRVPSPALERAARETLLDVALSFSPRVAPAPLGHGAFVGEAAVHLDASGVAALFRSESGFASALGARAQAQGLAGHVAVASSRQLSHWVARAAAHAGAGQRVLQAGNERRFLGPLPIDLLDPEDSLAASLTRFGVYRVRDLLRLPRRGLAQRLGPHVLRLLAQVNGEEVEAPLPRRQAPHLEEAIDLEFPVEHLEPLLFVLRGLLSRLHERLQLRNQVFGPLHLELRQSGGARDAREVVASAPTRDVRVLLRLLALALESHPSEAAIEHVSLRTEGRTARSDQLDFFLPRGPDPAALDRTLSELESLCGEARVGAPQVADDHRPDQFAMKPFAPLAPAAIPDPVQAPINPNPRSPSGVRALRPPVAAQVRVERGQPVFLRCGVAKGRILEAAGPWRTTGRWWSDGERFALDYYDVWVEDGTVLRLRYDWLGRRWQVDGLYD